MPLHFVQTLLSPSPTGTINQEFRGVVSTSISCRGAVLSRRVHWPRVQVTSHQPNSFCQVQLQLYNNYAPCYRTVLLCSQTLNTIAFESSWKPAALRVITLEKHF